MNTYLINFGFIHICIIVILLWLFYYLLRLNNAINLNMRIGKYCLIEKKKTKIIYYFYYICIGISRSISNFIGKIPIMEVYFSKYKKYISPTNQVLIPADFISIKILNSFIFLFIIMNIYRIDGNIVTNAQIIVFTLLGYIIPDLFYIIELNHRKQ